MQLVARHPVEHPQPFPSQPIIVIQPYSAGGLLDMGSRIMSAHAEKLLGQRIVVENRTGGGGKVGTEAMPRAPRMDIPLQRSAAVLQSIRPCWMRRSSWNAQ